MTHPERSESTTGGVAVRRVAGAALFWLLAEQAEEGGRKDELACSARGRTNFASSASLPAYSTQVFCAEGWQSGALRLGRGGTRSLTSGWERGAPGRGSRVIG